MHMSTSKSGRCGCRRRDCPISVHQHFPYHQRSSKSALQTRPRADFDSCIASSHHLWGSTVCFQTFFVASVETERGVMSVPGLGAHALQLLNTLTGLTLRTVLFHVEPLWVAHFRARGGHVVSGALVFSIVKDFCADEALM